MEQRRAHHCLPYPPPARRRGRRGSGLGSDRAEGARGPPSRPIAVTGERYPCPRAAPKASLPRAPAATSNFLSPSTGAESAPGTGRAPPGRAAGHQTPDASAQVPLVRTRRGLHNSSPWACPEPADVSTVHLPNTLPQEGVQCIRSPNRWQCPRGAVGGLAAAPAPARAR